VVLFATLGSRCDEKKTEKKYYRQVKRFSTSLLKELISFNGKHLNVIANTIKIAFGLIANVVV